ncbi:hypothetical protein [Agromyces archimandritae]|uniref:DUF3558 domain-containing protein n=1 Tax=Agromyces archimandritae TaxID=2781962 RepID=A0A975IPE7_9MICO|nr:hypothetical protein [Agromyces archimandritae]QTX05510.1 hypothetical protein G127AT_04645 [Agromyces archimandritae]
MSAQIPLARRPVFWLGALLGVVLLIGAFAMGITFGSPSGEAAAPPASETERPSPSEEADAKPTPTADPAVDFGPLPKECTGLYTHDFTPEVVPLVLNPAWTTDPAGGFDGLGTNDPGVAALLEPAARLQCAWADPEAVEPAFVVTTGAVVTAEQRDAAFEALGAAGFSCYEEAGGTRCIIEGEGGDGPWGESHFFRDDAWLATKWNVIAPDGYTPDMVAAVWG